MNFPPEYNAGVKRVERTRSSPRMDNGPQLAMYVGTRGPQVTNKKTLRLNMRDILRYAEPTFCCRRSKNTTDVEVRLNRTFFFL